MSTWQVTNRTTGEVVYAYTSDEAVDWPDYPFSTHNHNIVVPEVEQDPARIITKREYLVRFTQAERVAIRTAAKSSVELEDYLALLEISEEIDLDDEDLIAGLSTLEAAGLIAEGRAAEIRA